ncbi:GTPase Era [Pseudodesulfovibrio profundus]|uniref:GTPase Era n=1 Tax=Pseudodesulfovibrio profundus TaxID=57320 RepID=A0A2C8F870_9BACT|nr:GTPase Era [Pseudodesulfovibrio profundus]MBC17367.1 GTPase Era [Desulfovibrio sp.]SOB58639.1 GTPase Era [Pseudodesulfovibrio profundus]|tara:strand:+ start:416 stop:1324 length:909 start_codon:yes stop_codon:yes gene_type:complete
MHKFGTVALIGPPNAGKSTLMNQYIGQKVAIVSPRPQTTRNRISGIYTDDESQIVFLDTPGIHQLRGKMNRFLLESAWNALASADAVVVLIDAALYAAKPHLLDKEIKPLVKPVKETGRPVLVAVNKVDRVKDKPTMLPVMAKLGELWPEAEFIPISALRGQGTDELKAKILDIIPEGPPMFPEDQISTAPVRFMASEIIREKLFYSLRQELPYTTAVEIEVWDEESRPDMILVNAVIYTAQKNHKGMIIGKQGANLKKVGSEARKEISELLDSKVHLELWVKVRSGWTEDPGFLRAMGLGE